MAEVLPAFLQRHVSGERIREIRMERVARIAANQGVYELVEGARLIVHVIPLVAFEQLQPTDIRTVADLDPDLRPILFSDVRGECFRRLNIDGICAVVGRRPNSIQGYCQFFRSGIIESVDWLRLLDGKYMCCEDMERNIANGVNRLLKILHDVGQPSPYALFLSMTGVKGCQLNPSPYSSETFDTPHPIDRDILLIPEGIVEKYTVDVNHALNPLIDAVWNASGWRESHSRFRQQQTKKP